MAAQPSWARRLPTVNDSASFEIAYMTSAQVALESDELYGSGSPRIIGNSAALRRVLGMVRIVVPTDSTVLINGKTGTGKELIAEAIGPLPELPCRSQERSQPSELSAPVTLKEAERSHILQTLLETGGVIGRQNGAAVRLRLPRTTLISKMRRLGINPFQDSSALAQTGSGHKIQRRRSQVGSPRPPPFG